MISPIGEIEGVGYSEKMVVVDGTVRLRVMLFEPVNCPNNAPVLFVAGWVSSVVGWASLVRVLARTRPVYYLETREKPSALIENEAALHDDDFSLAQNAKDIIKVAEHFGINTPATLACGSSLGATAIIEAMKAERLKVGAAFLVGPNTRFPAPRSLTWLLHLPACFFPPIKHFVIWYLRTFRVNAKKEPEQMKRYEETIKTAEPKRLKHSARSVILGGYEIWGDIETVRTPIAVAYAASDKLHSHASVIELAKRLPCGKLNPCPTNLYMHTEALLADIEAFEANLKVTG